MGLKVVIFANNFRALGAPPPYPRNGPLLQICGYKPDAEHPMRLMLSKVEPRFQKLLKRNGNKCVIKPALLCSVFLFL